MRYPVAKLLRAPIEGWIRRGESRAVLEPTEFPWAQAVERRHAGIKREALAILERADDVVSFNDVLPNQRALAQNDLWKSYFLTVMGEPLAAHQAACPATSQALESIPGLLNAFFSILRPGVEIPPHRGPYAGILRYHLGVVIPEGDVGIRVRDQTLRWREGRSLVFDDSFEHEAWNRTNRPRVILFVDFVRPLTGALRLANAGVLGAFARTRAATNAKRQVERTQLQ